MGDVKTSNDSTVSKSTRYGAVVWQRAPAFLGISDGAF